MSAARLTRRASGLSSPSRSYGAYYQESVAELSALLRCCNRALVVGFGTARHWHLPKAFDSHAEFVTDLFCSQGGPRVGWPGTFLFHGGLPHPRTPEDETAGLLPPLSGPRRLSYALPKLFERTFIRALSWLGANAPAYDGRSLDAYLELVEAHRKARAAETGAAAISDGGARASEHERPQLEAALVAAGTVPGGPV